MRRISVLFVLLFGGAIFLIGARAGAQPYEGPANALWLLQGRVFEGPEGFEGQPLPDVVVSLYGGSDPYPVTGTFIISAATDPNGWYGLEAPDGFEYYHIIETDPPGYASVAARTVSGTVKTPNWIQYEGSLRSQNLTGNRFWDELEVGWLRGRVLDSETGDLVPPCTEATVLVVETGDLAVADPATGAYGPFELPPGGYAALAEAAGYSSEQLDASIFTGVTTTLDFNLWRPVVEVTPESLISVTAQISQPTSYPLTITNSGHWPLDYTLLEEPGDLPWVWEDPISGTVPGPGAAVVDVTFHCTELGDLVGALVLAHNDPCQPPLVVPIELHCQEPPPPGWEKWVNGIPWHPDLVVTAETSDTIVVIDVVSPLPLEPLTLLEEWNPDRLTLLDTALSPGAPPPIVGPGSLEWPLPEGDPTEVYTLTKWFHVEPCTWLTTTLVEALLRGGIAVAERPVPVTKIPPDLWIDSAFNPPVYAGDTATFTLQYGNAGGYENGVMIRNTFPPEAPFAFSFPAPDRRAPDNSWAEWDVGDLTGGGGGLIEVLVAIDETVAPSTTLVIWDGIFNHVGDAVDQTWIEYHVEPPPGAEWSKWINSLPWDPDLVVTVETSDTIRVVDIVSSTQPLELVEQWDPAQLRITGYSIEPPVGVPISDSGILIWPLPPGLVTVTKSFHVEPCDWEFTLLHERLAIPGAPEPLQRAVIVRKLPAALWLDSTYQPEVQVGQPATFTLHYGNAGGREFGAWIFNEFPPTARFAASMPPPTAHDPAGLWARWDLEVLEMGQQGEIEVAVDIAPDLPPSATLPIWDGIFDHVGRIVSDTLILFHVPRPPVTFPGGDWPWYAQGEIHVNPEPPVAHQPTHLCADVVNHDPTQPHQVTLQFSVASFGIGLPWTPVGTANVTVPPAGLATGCVVWVPPIPQHWCVQVRVLGEAYPLVISQRNVDVDEPLEPGVPHSRVFLLGNPFDRPVTVTLGLVPHVPGWWLELSSDVVPNLLPGQTRPITLTVTPPAGGALLPPDGTPIVDVEAFVEGRLIGGWRKVFRPPVPLHRFPDPIYAEREITITPYPPRAGEPTELCVELRNPTGLPHTVVVHFAWARFGIGLPFTPINGPQVVHLPPHSLVKTCIWWVPPFGGQFCAQVLLTMDNYPPQVSRRNIDVDEPLAAGVAHARVFPVGNPLDHPVTITLGLIPHLPDWGLELYPDVLPNMLPGQTRPVTLTVTPPSGQPLPPDGTVIVDVEAFVEGKLIGGWRKIYRPPVPIHRPRDPVYAESEIGVDPYPAVPGQPVKLSVEVYNPTNQDQVVTATFSVAPFGIGLPFSTSHITPNPIRIFVPAHGAARGHVVWQVPGWRGKFCVRVTLQLPGHEPVWSQRNIDVGEPLRPGQPHALVFPVGNPYAEPVTITLGLINHRPGWQMSVSPSVIANVASGQVVSGTLLVTPTLGAELGTGTPIADVEAYVGAELLGGFRKLDIPPVPLHKPHEKPYAESEILVVPYPPQQGQPTQVGAVLQNSGDVTATVELAFGWANFGAGIPFTDTGMAPPTTTVTVSPHLTATGWVTWTPDTSGHQCIRVLLTDPDGIYRVQRSQRNVDVAERPPCDTTKVFTFTVYNDSPFTATVDVGMITFNVPPDWQVTVTPTGTIQIGPFGEAVITVMVTIPCPLNAAAALDQQRIAALQQAAGSVATIDVEAYRDGQLIGGIEIRFGAEPSGRQLYLPLLLRN